MQNQKLNFLWLMSSVLIMMGCQSNPLGSEYHDFDHQGHRGCRGLLPENTISGFIKALDLGVQTLEMDCVISKDKKVVVSHEPFFNHEIATGPNGLEITKENDKSHNIYKMPYDSIVKYDVGLKFHPRFPEQKKIPAIKPLLSDVIKSSEKHAAERNLRLPFYNIEIKRHKDYDGIYHPEVREFAELVLEVVKKEGILERTTIQSFDVESLQVTRNMEPKVSTALLVENQNSFKSNLDLLGFKPTIYSCHYSLLDSMTVKILQDMQIKVIPWTANSPSSIESMLDFGVDGIISDYPDRVNKVLKTRLDRVK